MQRRSKNAMRNLSAIRTMRSRQRVGNLTRIPDRRVNGQRPAQNFALNQLQHQVVDVARFFEAVDCRDVGVIE